MTSLEKRIESILSTIDPTKVKERHDTFIDCSAEKSSPFEHEVSSPTTSSHNYPPELVNLIEEKREGWVLDCGSGSRDQKYSNVVNFDIQPYNGVDVVGLAEELPFEDECFDLVISLVVLEHVKDPRKAALEMQRVLKKGGLLWIDAAFMQPYHGFPSHYYNMTQQGLEQLLLPDMQIVRNSIPNYGTPIWSITWILSRYACSLPEKTRERFLKLPISELLESPRNLQERDFVTNLSEEGVKELAATVSVLAKKSKTKFLSTEEKRQFEGHLDHTEEGRIFGWVSDKKAPHERFAVRLNLSNGWSKTIIAKELREDLRSSGIGDGKYGFSTRVPYKIAHTSNIKVEATLVDHDYQLDKSGRDLIPEFPIAYIAGDITNNCNLRCPFCVSDYSMTGRLKAMDPEVFKKLLTVIHLVPDGMFWLSCMHEATIHPRFLELLKSIPTKLRKKVSFTTNLCKNLDDETLRTFADSGLHNIRISIDSFEAEMFSELRKGGRVEVFLHNLTRLSSFLKESSNPPEIRFITMVFNKNLNEIEKVIAYCKELIPNCFHEVRFIFYQPHIANWGMENILSMKSWEMLKSRIGQVTEFSHVEFFDPLPETHKAFEERKGTEDYKPTPEIFGGSCSPSKYRQADPLVNNSTVPNEPLRLRMRWDGLIVHELISENDFLQYSQDLDPNYFKKLRVASQTSELNDWERTPEKEKNGAE